MSFSEVLQSVLLLHTQSLANQCHSHSVMSSAVQSRSLVRVFPTNSRKEDEYVSNLSFTAVIVVPARKAYPTAATPMDLSA